MVAVPHPHPAQADPGIDEWAEATAMFSWNGTPTYGGPEGLPPERRGVHRVPGRRRRPVWAALVIESCLAPVVLLRPAVGRRLPCLPLRRSARVRPEFPMLPAVGRQVRW